MGFIGFSASDLCLVKSPCTSNFITNFFKISNRGEGGEKKKTKKRAMINDTWSINRRSNLSLSSLLHQIPQTTLMTLVARRRIAIAIISHLLEEHETKTKAENPNTRVVLPPLPDVIAIASSSVALSFCFCVLSCFRFCFGCSRARASSLPHLRIASHRSNNNNQPPTLPSQ